MRFVIGCIDGNWYQADDVDEVEFQKHLDECDGYIGTGAMKHLRTRTVDDYIDFFLTFMVTGEYDGIEATDVTLTIDGRERVFNASAIIWAEARR